MWSLATVLLNHGSIENLARFDWFMSGLRVIRKTTMFWALMAIFAGVSLLVLKHQVRTLEGDLQRCRLREREQEQGP